jgi:hypothetical protein
MLPNKQCPKCGGTLFVDTDKYGPYVSCRNCGYLWDLAPGKPLPKVSAHDQDFPATIDGCRVSPSCFTCPLPECQYEAPSTTKAWLQDRRVLEAFAEYQHLGTTAAVRATVQAIKVTERTVFRALSRNRQAVAAVREAATA